MRRAVAAMLATAATGAAACEIPAGFAPLARIESRGIVVAFKPVPAPIVVGRHFALDVIVCATDGAAPGALRVDAQMPEHRHGMNYRAAVAPRGTGRWRAEGLLFHMPGRWQFVFDVERGAQRERLTRDYVLE
jgi:hypothetical protein